MNRTHNRSEHDCSSIEIHFCRWSARPVLSRCPYRSTERLHVGSFRWGLRRRNTASQKNDSQECGSPEGHTPSQTQVQGPGPGLLEAWSRARGFGLRAPGPLASAAVLTPLNRVAFVTETRLSQGTRMTGMPSQRS